jgi:hypothetical protein
MFEVAVAWLTGFFFDAEGMIEIEPVIGVIVGFGAMFFMAMFYRDAYKKPFRIAAVRNYWRDEDGNERSEERYHPERLYFGLFVPWFIRKIIFKFNGLDTLDGFDTRGSCERWIEQHWAKKRKTETSHHKLDLI